jgi:hypothetical protein
MREEHYEAQSKYADMLFEFLAISKWKHPFKSWRAFSAAEDFRSLHKKCCEWANETY